MAERPGRQHGAGAVELRRRRRGIQEPRVVGVDGVGEPRAHPVEGLEQVGARRADGGDLVPDPRSHGQRESRSAGQRERDPRAGKPDRHARKEDGRLDRAEAGQGRRVIDVQSLRERQEERDRSPDNESDMEARPGLSRARGPEEKDERR